MRTIWQSDNRGGRLTRLIFGIASFIATLFVVTHVLTFVGASKVDADGVAFIVALIIVAFVMYG